MKRKWLAAGFLLISLGAARLAWAQDKPLTRDQVLNLVRNQLGDETGARAVQERGIDFEPTEEFLQSLRDAGAKDIFVKAVREAKRPAAPGPTPSTPLDFFQVTDLLISGVSSDRIASLVQDRGISFPPNSADLELLQALGAQTSLLDAVKAAKVSHPDRAATKAHAQISEQDYRERLAQDPTNAAVRLALSFALRWENKLDEESQVLREGVLLNPADGRMHYQLGLMALLTKDTEGAITEFREAVRLNPEDFSSHVGLGNALKNKSDLDGAIEQYREALHLDPARSPTRMYLASLLYQKGDVDAAEAECRETMRLDPSYPQAHSGLATVLAKKGDTDGAITEYREALRLNPSMPDAHFSLGNALYGKGDYDAALGEFREAVRLNPALPEPHLGAGNVLYRKGDFDGAISEYREVLNHSAQNASAHYNLGLALEKKGNPREALDEYRQASQLQPQNTQFKQACDRLSALTNSQSK